MTSDQINLRKENAKLRRELQLCMRERDRLLALQPFKRGREGERYIAKLVGGTITNARHDVNMKTGQRLEVKWGRLRTRVPGKKTMGWTWRHLLGEDGKKKYNRLILLGPVDERFRKRTDGPYVIFDIPFAAVALLPNPKCLSVSTDPNRGFSKISARLYRRYLTTEHDIRKNYQKA